MMRDFENQEQQDGDEDEADQVLSCKIKSNPITDVPKGSQVSPTIPPPINKLVRSFNLEILEFE